MNPKELQEKALSLLQPLLLDAYEMVVEPREKKSEDSRFCSHFNGDPYFEPGEEWPMLSVGKKNIVKEPYDFIFQVVNDGTIGLPESIAIFQFYCIHDRMPCREGWLVKTYGAMDRTNGITIESPIKRDHDHDTRKYCAITFERIRLLPDWFDIDDYVPQKELTKLCKGLEEFQVEKYSFEIYKELCHVLQAKTDAQSHCGGYPRWVQGNDVRGDKLAFQIEPGNKSDILWDLYGVMYLFFDSQKEGEFLLTIQCD